MARQARGSVRIIGGRWRGTRVDVLERPSLRPSSDRVRETLFNWLAPWLDGARCLDLFAGSGVLGFEAVSRGAASACLVERDAALVGALEALRERLDAADLVTIERADVAQWLAGAPRVHDIVFLDPPFDSACVPAVLAALERGWLAPHALIYLEQPAGTSPETPGWRVAKAGRTRHVSYKLLERTG